MYPVSFGIPQLFKKIRTLVPLRAQTLFFSHLSAEKTTSGSSSYTEKLASLLEKSYDVHSLKKLHACIFIHGLETNANLGSKLLNSYALFGLLPESRWVFSKIINKNISLWNSILVGYFKAGQFDEVFRVYSDLRQRKIGIHSSAITVSLKSCVQSCSLGFGKSIHVDVLKFGLSTDPFVGSSLIGFYSSHRDMEGASHMFDEITERDVVVYTSMITGYAQTGDHQAYKAFMMASCMQNENLDPNRVTLVSLLQAAAQLRLLEHGESVHAYAIRRGIGCSDEVFRTSLIDMYIKCGDLNKATMIFSEMNRASTGCWNALIAGHLKLGQPLEALSIFSHMAQENHKLDLITLANGILGCADLGLLREGKSIHGYIFRTGVQLDVVAKTALIDMYFKCNHCSTAREIFDTLVYKDVISFNVMMAGYLQNGHAYEAIEGFRSMIRSGVTANQSAILTVISAFADLKHRREGKRMHAYVIRHGFELSTDIVNQIMYFYVKCGRIDCARQVFDRTKHKDLVSWTSMVMGYESHGHADDAITLFRVMLRDSQHNPDSVTLTCLLQAFSQLGCLSLVKEIHCRVLRVSMEKEIPVMNSLLTTYSKCGMYKTARDLFGQMDMKCLASWNTMIAACGMHSDCVEALKLFDQMKRSNIVPDEATFTSILSSCSHAGLVKEGLNLFRSMIEDYKFVPREEHYSCLVDLLGRAGRLDEAYNLLKFLPSAQSASALSALASACRVHGNNKMGEDLGRLLLDLEPRNPSSYGLVSNIYAEGEKWNEAAQIRATAKEIGLKRTTGCSFIELDN